MTGSCADYELYELRYHSESSDFIINPKRIKSIVESSDDKGNFNEEDKVYRIREAIYFDKKAKKMIRLNLDDFLKLKKPLVLERRIEFQKVK
jgi:hypothetical protein